MDNAESTPEQLILAADSTADSAGEAGTDVTEAHVQLALSFHQLYRGRVKFKQSQHRGFKYKDLVQDMDWFLDQLHPNTFKHQLPKGATFPSRAQFVEALQRQISVETIARWFGVCKYKLYNRIARNKQVCGGTKRLPRALAAQTATLEYKAAMSRAVREELVSYSPRMPSDLACNLRFIVNEYIDTLETDMQRKTDELRRELAFDKLPIPIPRAVHALDKQSGSTTTTTTHFLDAKSEAYVKVQRWARLGHKDSLRTKHVRAYLKAQGCSEIAHSLDDLLTLVVFLNHTSPKPPPFIGARKAKANPWRTLARKSSTCSKRSKDLRDKNAPDPLSVQTCTYDNQEQIPPWEGLLQCNTQTPQTPQLLCLPPLFPTTPTQSQPTAPLQIPSLPSTPNVITCCDLSLVDDETQLIPASTPSPAAPLRTQYPLQPRGQVLF
eukprot:m.144418 g.144418  ORF g.144418 m.144418 type:complete len:438 (-) comp14128_c0_seq2:73-1386(-)